MALRFSWARVSAPQKRALAQRARAKAPGRGAAPPPRAALAAGGGARGGGGGGGEGGEELEGAPLARAPAPGARLAGPGPARRRLAPPGLPPRQLPGSQSRGAAARPRRAARAASSPRGAAPRPSARARLAWPRRRAKGKPARRQGERLGAFSRSPSWGSAGSAGSPGRAAEQARPALWLRSLTPLQAGGAGGAGWARPAQPQRGAPTCLPALLRSQAAGASAAAAFAGEEPEEASRSASGLWPRRRPSSRAASRRRRWLAPAPRAFLEGSSSASWSASLPRPALLEQAPKAEASPFALALHPCRCPPLGAGSFLPLLSKRRPLALGAPGARAGTAGEEGRERGGFWQARREPRRGDIGGAKNSHKLCLFDMRLILLPIKF